MVVVGIMLRVHYPSAKHVHALMGLCGVNRRPDGVSVSNSFLMRIAVVVWFVEWLAHVVRLFGIDYKKCAAAASAAAIHNRCGWMAGNDAVRIDSVLCDTF